MSNARRGESIIHLGGVKERRKRDEHVGNVAEINWKYYQESDSARRWSLHRECTFRPQELSSSRWGNSNLPNDKSSAFVRHSCFSFKKIKFLLGWFRWRYWSVNECTSFRWHLIPSSKTSLTKIYYFQRKNLNVVRILESCCLASLSLLHLEVR